MAEPPHLPGLPRITGRRPVGWTPLIWTGLAVAVLSRIGLRDHALRAYHVPALALLRND